MNKAIKLKNNTFIDSTSITHNKKTLSDRINNSYKEILQQQYTGATINGVLTESIDNFDFLIVVWSPFWLAGNIRTVVIPVSTIRIVQQDEYTYEDADFQTTSVWKNIGIGFSSKNRINLKCFNTSTWNAGSTGLISVKGIKLT